jgi:hypothetical protein
VHSIAALSYAATVSRSDEASEAAIISRQPFAGLTAIERVARRRDGRRP